MKRLLVNYGSTLGGVMNIGLIEQQINQIQLQASEQNQLVSVEHIPEDFRVVGIGTDAVVVRDHSFPQYVWKVFAPQKVEKKSLEYKVYQRLGSSPFFATCYAQGENYLCLSYEEGPTLYQCLEEGIVIPRQVIIDVDEARRYARSRGLNPRDIHLKNVLLQNGRAKLIDVSEYLNPGNDYRWDYLVQGYEQFYSLIRGKKIPTWMIELVKNAYYHQVSDQFSVVDFCQRFVQLLGLNK